MSVHHDPRRVVAAEMRVTELDAPARDERRGMVRDGALQDAGQCPGLDLYEEAEAWARSMEVWISPTPLPWRAER